MFKVGDKLKINPHAVEEIKSNRFMLAYFHKPILYKMIDYDVFEVYSIDKTFNRVYIIANNESFVLQINFNTGAVSNIGSKIPFFIKLDDEPIKTYSNVCPLCGFEGNLGFNSFYCSNKKCQNYVL